MPSANSTVLKRPPKSHLSQEKRSSYNFVDGWLRVQYSDKIASVPNLQEFIRRERTEPPGAWEGPSHLAMVKTIMSTDGSESEQMDSLSKTKDKLKVQQRLIDISARNLQSTRLSSRDFSGSGTVTPGGGGVGEGQSAIEENIRLLEVRR